jgi:cell division protein FtsL
MNRLGVVLAAVLVVCALGLVTSQHRARKLFVDLERAQAQARQLEVQWNQLQLEQHGLAKASLIDAKARSGLAMRPAAPERTLHLTIETPVEQTAQAK